MSDRQFKHFMLKEIYEQSDVIEQCLERYSPPLTSVPLNNVDQIHILACGTSLNAGLIGQYWFEQLAGISTQVRSSSEFLSAPLLEMPNTLTIAVTQSGETADTIAAIKETKSSRLAITNGIDSTITKLVDHTLYANAGEEKSVAATKTFTAQLMLFYSLALTIAYQKQRLDDQQLELLLTQLHQLPKQIEIVLQQESNIAAIAQTLKNTRSLIVLGSGINASIAMEGALKLKEATYTHAEGYAAGEFLHGPIALLDDQIPVIAIATEAESGVRVMKTVDRIRANGGKVILFNPPPVLEILTPFLAIVPLQLLAYHLAIARNIDVDRPRNITKSLTN
jgi:glucosamine--fructose-6-phosphate aminotransferase (isomerizing)